MSRPFVVSAWFLAATLILGFPSEAARLAAAGLGELTVESPLGRPLRAHVPLLPGAGIDLGAACAVSYRGRDEAPGLADVALTLEGSGQTSRIRISTAKAVMEPVLGFTIELTCREAGRWSRDYVVLLDPPKSALRRRPVPIDSAAADGPGQAGVVPPVETGRPRVAGPALQVPAEDFPPLRVQRGDSLLRILPAREEPPRAGLKMAWELDPARLSGALAAAARRRLRDAAAQFAPVPAPRPLADPAAQAAGDEPAPDGPAVNGRDADRQRSSKKELEQALALVSRLRERNRELDARVTATVPQAPVAQAARSPWYWWVLVPFAVGLVFTGAYLLGRRARPGRAAYLPFADPEEPEPGDSARHDRPAAEPPALPEAVFAPGDTIAQAPTGLPAGTWSPSTGVGLRPALDFDLGLESEDAVRAPARDAGTKQPAAIPGGAPGTDPARPERSLKAVPGMLLEVELHLLYEQHDEALNILGTLVDADTGGEPEVRPWSMLFDLLRKLEDRDAFAALSSRFGRRYNIVAPTWGSADLDAADNGLEVRFPRILQRVAEVWGTAEALAFLDDLLLDNRGGQRQGFALGVAEDIGFLRAVLYQRLA